MANVFLLAKATPNEWLAGDWRALGFEEGMKAGYQQGAWAGLGIGIALGLAVLVTVVYMKRMKNA